MARSANRFIAQYGAACQPCIASAKYGAVPQPLLYINNMAQLVNHHHCVLSTISSVHPSISSVHPSACVLKKVALLQCWLSLKWAPIPCRDCIRYFANKSVGDLYTWRRLGLAKNRTILFTILTQHRPTWLAFVPRLLLRDFSCRKRLSSITEPSFLVGSLRHGCLVVDGCHWDNTET